MNDLLYFNILCIFKIQLRQQWIIPILCWGRAWAGRDLSVAVPSFFLTSSGCVWKWWSYSQNGNLPKRWCPPSYKLVLSPLTSSIYHQQLDDGWPESVEEQGLLLLVWRHNFTNNIWKMCYRQSRRGVARQNSEKCKTIVCIANTFTHRRFYTQKLLHTEAFTHRSFYTEAITHKAFTHRSFYIQTLLHTDVFTHRRFYTDTVTHRHVYTHTFTHRPFYTQELLLHTNALTHRSFYT